VDVDPDRLGYDTAAVQRAISALGIEARIGQAFLCVLPAHRERHPSASIYRDPRTGLYVYRDWHRRDGKEWYTLAQVRAAKVGRRVRSNTPEAVAWYQRLFCEAGCLAPVEVPLPPVPPATPPSSVHKVAKGFGLLLGLRWLRSPGEPTPFARSFAESWSGCTPRMAGSAIRVLMRSPPQPAPGAASRGGWQRREN
jgi:hypothetical protein